MMTISGQERGLDNLHSLQGWQPEPARHPRTFVHPEAAVASNVIAPPALSLEQVVEMQEAEIAAYSKPEFQNQLWKILESAPPEEHAHLRQQLCLDVQVPLVASMGFEPTALGVCQATEAVLQFHGEGKVQRRNAILTDLLNPKPLAAHWEPPTVPLALTP
ncbi:unnamed protein product [Durusdinium trenchii]